MEHQKQYDAGQRWGGNCIYGWHYIPNNMFWFKVLGVGFRLKHKEALLTFEELQGRIWHKYMPLPLVKWKFKFIIGRMK